jgi:hypothetical protein
MAGESASPTTLQLCRKHSVQSRLIAFMLHGMRLSFNNLMSFMLPKIDCVLLEINFHVLYAVNIFFLRGGGGSAIS